MHFWLNVSVGLFCWWCVFGFFVAVVVLSPRRKQPGSLLSFQQEYLKLQSLLTGPGTALFFLISVSLLFHNV